MKLVYFNARGLAETSRFLFAINHHEYEDFRYPIHIIDGKYIRDEFELDLEKGQFEQSMGKLPYLQIKNDIICQSKAIERFLARHFNMMGSNDIEEAHIDSICECIRDFKEHYTTIKNNEHEVHKFFETDLPNKLHKLSLMMNKNGSSFGFSVSHKLSLSDIVIYTFIMDFFGDKQQNAIQSCKHSPKIRSILKTVHDLPAVQSWLKERPVTMF